MRTAVRICFDSSDVLGGTQSILGPAGCGPDVAVVKDVPALRRVDVEVTLDVTDHRLRILLELLARHGLTWLDLRWDRYTDEELDRACLMIMQPKPEYTIFGGPRLGTSYDMADACSACGAGARQTSPLLIDGKDLPALEGLRAASTYYCDVIVDERLAEDLEDGGTTGLSFRSVYAVMPDKRQVKLRWKQLCAARALPAMSPRSTGIEHRDGCSSCERSGVFTVMNEPPRLVYRAWDLDRTEDVHTTWEWFESWSFDGDVSDALFPYPWTLVTPKVRRVFLAAGVTSFDWLPIRVEDADGNITLPGEEPTRPA